MRCTGYCSGIGSKGGGVTMRTEKSIKELEHEREQANNLAPVIASEIASVQQDVQDNAPTMVQDKILLSNQILGKNFMNIKEFINSTFTSIRRNIVTNTTEYIENNGEYVPIDDLVLNSIFMRLNAIYPKASLQQLVQYLESQDVPSYNPFRNYFDNLTNYEPSEPNYLTELCNSFDVPINEQQRLYTYLRTWLIGLYVQALEIELNDNMLVFIGIQGCGKGLFAEKIIPIALRKYYLPSEQLNKIDKDFILKLSQNICLEIDELDLTKAKQGELKNLISKKSGTERQAYARYATKFPRRASFIGSSNLPNFLGDVTGSRRFLALQVNKIYVDNIDNELVTNVYRQMIYEYNQAPTSWRLAPNEISENNEQFRLTSYIEDLIIKVFRFEPENGYEAKVLNRSELLDYLVSINPNIRTDEATAKNVTKAMTALKIEQKAHRINGEIRKGYKVYVPSYSQI